MTADQAAVPDTVATTGGGDAERAGRAALETARAGGDPAAVSAALLHLGAVLVAAGRAGPALPVGFEALTVAAGRGDEWARYQATVELGLAYQQLGRWLDAYRALLDALELAQRLDDHHTVPFLRAGIAASLVGLGRLTDALPAAQLAVDAYRAVVDPAGLGRALVTWGQALFAAGDQEGARTVWREAQLLLAAADPAGAEAAREQLATR